MLMRKLIKIKKLQFNSIFKLKTSMPDFTSSYVNIYQAKMGSAKYVTLSDAIMCAKTSEKTLIKLLSDVRLYDSNINIGRGKNIVLDLAGHSITSCNEDGTIYLEGSLTLIDTSRNQTGLIENTYSNGMGIHFYKSGSLNVYGGTILGCCALYSWNEYFTPKVTIRGGIIKGKHFGVSFRNSENLTVKYGIISGGITAFNIWNK